MAVESVQPGTALQPSRLRLPERIPDLKQPWLKLFQLVWIPALLLAVLGPAIGTWYRLTTASQNLALVLGSRVGLALSDYDLTNVRFPVGDAARAAGVQPGDDIIAINGAPVAKVVPISERGMARPNDATDQDYELFGAVIQGADGEEVRLRLRGADGAIREFTAASSERHIEQGARGLGLPTWFLNIFDLLHVLTYPFLLFAAWILHRRKPEDLVSSILSLAILLTIASEQPSFAFLINVLKVPQPLHQLLYDCGNILLLLGILLFPFGQLRPRIVVGLAALLPVLLFLQGDLYRLMFMLLITAAVALLLLRLRNTASGDARQQLKWALFGFSGYALFLAVPTIADLFKPGVGSFGKLLTLEVLGGFSFGIAFLCLQMGILIALLRFRLYDAEVVISRSATFALVTLIIGGVFAATSEGVKELALNLLGRDAGSGPTIFAAALATILVSPAQERIQRWSERRFQRQLVALRDDLPECVRDMRVTASLHELLEEVLARIQSGVRTTRLAVAIGGQVASMRGVRPEELEAWRASNEAGLADTAAEGPDTLFPVRIPLRITHGANESLGWLLVGPRPDGSNLGKDEREALEEVADPVARAIKIVTRREGREREVEQLIARHEQRIRELEGRLDDATATVPPAAAHK
ncbi:hypothetical protein [Sphingomonas sp.]|uniref:hypothetical protein n=1 Tax=Sphingomonas sp. TaxID=28214 RepID=UPI00286E1D60|nr:hypothetical protein [Sphingomonas sp.]